VHRLGEWDRGLFVKKTGWGETPVPEVIITILFDNNRLVKLLSFLADFQTIIWKKCTRQIARRINPTNRSNFHAN